MVMVPLSYMHFPSADARRLRPPSGLRKEINLTENAFSISRRLSWGTSEWNPSDKRRLLPPECLVTGDACCVWDPISMGEHQASGGESRYLGQTAFLVKELMEIIKISGKEKRHILRSDKAQEGLIQYTMLPRW